MEHLRGLRGPVMFTPNHHLHFDNAIILSSIPLGWRWRLTVAAAADDIFGSLWRDVSAALIANAFPLVRQGAIRRSLELLGARLDREFSVLTYPEGKLTIGGPMQPFLSGAGLIAVEGGTPVVPMKLKVRKMALVDRFGAANGVPAEVKKRAARTAGWGLRGDVDVVFGKPSCSRPRPTAPPRRSGSRPRSGRCEGRRLAAPALARYGIVTKYPVMPSVSVPVVPSSMSLVPATRMTLFCST